MSWYWGTFVGALLLSALNSFERVMPITVLNSIRLLPLLFIVNIGFWWGYAKGPKFISVWFLGEALASLTGFLTGIILFDKHIELANLFGVLFILIGSYLLVI